MSKPVKGTSYTITHPMISATAPESFITGEAGSMVDTAYYWDNPSGPWTSLPIADTYSEIGSSGVYEITLSASEMNHDRIMVKTTSTNSQDTLTLLDLNTNDIDDVHTLVTTVNTTVGTNGVAISTAQKNSIADHVLRRHSTNVEGSSDGDAINTMRSLYGAVAKATNKTSISGGTLTVTKTDDTTSLGTQTLTTDAGADPITDFDTV